MTFAILSLDGKTPVKKETLKISESSVEISFLWSFSILLGILLGPVDLFESREDTILIISYLSVGCRWMYHRGCRWFIIVYTWFDPFFINIVWKHWWIIMKSFYSSIYIWSAGYKLLAILANHSLWDSIPWTQISCKIKTEINKKKDGNELKFGIKL